MPEDFTNITLVEDYGKGSKFPMLDKKTWLKILSCRPVAYKVALPDEYFMDDKFLKQCDNAVIEYVKKLGDTPENRSKYGKLFKEIKERKVEVKRELGGVKEMEEALPYESFLNMKITGKEINIK